MPKFIVRQYRDAVVVYDGEIEASSADEAFELAKTSNEIVWIKVSGGEIEYGNADAEVFAADGETSLRGIAEFW